MDTAGLPIAERNVERVVEMVLDATRGRDKPLTPQRLFQWHELLFPDGKSGLHDILVGQWRTGPMQVVSGGVGHEQVHFEAPAAHLLEDEMSKFLSWFGKSNDIDGVLKAAVAHLWFVTIHPFDDGNGRIARAILDMSLAKWDRQDWRYYSMSAQILKERDAYFTILERTQKASLDITSYLTWFVECLDNALSNAEETLAKSWIDLAFGRPSPACPQRASANDDRSIADDFYGKLTNDKWVKMTRPQEIRPCATSTTSSKKESWLKTIAADAAQAIRFE